MRLPETRTEPDVTLVQRFSRRHRISVEFPPQRYGGEHYRPDGYECAYLAELACVKCGGIGPGWIAFTRRCQRRQRLLAVLAGTGVTAAVLAILAVLGVVAWVAVTQSGTAG
jgi:hypothetical protein